ncbi:unnamed protein product [Rotaria sp. Silwood2]|nr:unnamed protein product [Rotaria sp. Silwood2]CAF4566295.1 unnamed protein product [Rotaria sp. Silwood2]
MTTAIAMSECKRIILVAHNNKKAELIEYLKQYGDILAQHKLCGTDTTGSLVEKELEITVSNFESDSLDRSQQLGAKITKHELDVFSFSIDPLNSHPHTANKITTEYIDQSSSVPTTTLQYETLLKNEADI